MGSLKIDRFFIRLWGYIYKTAQERPARALPHIPPVRLLCLQYSHTEPD